MKICGTYLSKQFRILTFFPYFALKIKFLILKSGFINTNKKYTSYQQKKSNFQ